MLQLGDDKYICIALQAHPHPISFIASSLLYGTYREFLLDEKLIPEGAIVFLRLNTKF